MKNKIMFVILLSLSFFTGIVLSDPRLETTQSNCHFLLDANNADNEMKVGECKVQGNTLYTRGYAWAEYSFSYNRLYSTVTILGDLNLKGSAYNHWAASNYRVVNTQCAIVLSNYNASTGVNDYQEYRTNDWIQERTAEIDPDNSLIVNVTYRLYCRKGVQN